VIDIAFAFKKLDCGGGLTWVLSLAPYLQSIGMRVRVQGPMILPAALARLTAAGLEWQQGVITDAKVIIDSSGGVTKRVGGVQICVRHHRNKWHAGWVDAMKAADVLVAVSSPVAGNMRKTLGREPLTITNGVDCERLDRVGEDLREKYGEQFLLGFVGRNSGLKNAVAVAKAPRKLQEPALLSGQGVAGSRRLNNRWTTLQGYTDTPGDVYRATDVLCVPSHNEAFPYCVLEAACMGKRVVVSARASCKEFADMVTRIPPKRGAVVSANVLAGFVKKALAGSPPNVEIARERFGLATFHKKWAQLLEKYL